MKLIFYEKIGNDIAGQLIRMMRAPIEKDEVHVYRRINDLSHELAQLSNYLFLLVIIVKDREDLVNIQEIKGLFRDMRIIVILPDRESETVKLGHELQPRFLTFRDADVSEVSRILGKMLKLPVAQFG